MVQGTITSLFCLRYSASVARATRSAVIPRTVDGLTMPYQHQNMQNGEQTSIAEFKKIEVNPQLEPKLFEKPAQKSAEDQGSKQQ